MSEIPPDFRRCSRGAEWLTDAAICRAKLDFRAARHSNGGVKERPNSLELLAVSIGAGGALPGFGLFCLLGPLVGSAPAVPLHISAMEGGPGYFALSFGVLSGLLGFAGGIWLTLRWRGAGPDIEIRYHIEPREEP